MGIDVRIPPRNKEILRRLCTADTGLTDVEQIETEA